MWRPSNLCASGRAPTSLLLMRCCRSFIKKKTRSGKRLESQPKPTTGNKAVTNTGEWLEVVKQGANVATPSRSKDVPKDAIKPTPKKKQRNNHHYLQQQQSEPPQKPQMEQERQQEQEEQQQVDLSADKCQEVEIEEMPPPWSSSLKRFRKQEDEEKEEKIQEKKSGLVEVGRRRPWKKPSLNSFLLLQPKRNS